MVQIESKNRKRTRLFPTIEDWAISVLEKSNAPLNYREITKRILEKRPINGATPDKSVYAILLRSERIKPLGNGMFDLVERQ